MQTEHTHSAGTEFRVDIVLLEPEIPQNTGNIVRTCAAVGSTLHLIEPLGFSLEDKYLKRAGLDYWSLMDIKIHKSFDNFLQSDPGANLFLFSKKADKAYHEAHFSGRCYLVFGKETWGLPDTILHQFPDAFYRIPMKAEARSLNLSNSVAITVYEALRQNGFPGLL
jgi:tRNA (cytidine/uridine-2'-O-)-methyltransferase